MLPLPVCSQSTYSKVIHEENYTGIQANGTYRNNTGELIISGNFGNGFSHISKVDALGNQIWTKTFAKTDQNNIDDNFIQKDQIIKLIDSNYLLTRNLIDLSNGKNLSYLIKFSENGALIWSKRTHKNDASNSSSSFSIEIENGKTLHALSPAGSGKLDILRLNSNGIIENQINLNIDPSAEPVAFIKDSLSSFLIVKTNNFSCLIMKIDSSGSFIKAKKLNNFLPADGIIYGSYLHLIGQDSNGQQFTAKVDFNQDSVYLLNSSNSVLARIKVLNNEIYTFTKESSHGSVISVDFDNSSTENYYYSGAPINMYSVDSSRFISIYNGPSFGFKMFGEPQVGLLLFDTLVWSDSFCFSTSNITSNLNSYDDILINNTLSLNSSIESVADSIFLSWNDGGLYTGLGCVDYFDGIEEQKLEESITLAPNPSHAYFSILSKERINAQVDLLSYNGEILSSSLFNGLKTDVSCAHLESGIYFIRISLQNGITTTKKMIVLH